MYLIILLSLLIVGLLIILVKKRKFKYSILKIQSRHPSGIEIYHPKTKVKWRASLEASSKTNTSPHRIIVLDFKGDIRASKRFELSKLLDEVCFNKNVIREVVIKVESPGGGVAEYGFLYAEIERLRIRCPGIQITVCVDTVAASGGYLMSLAAHKIMAAPFALVGSIGVVSFVPNIRKLLENFNIQPRTFTAGKYKRTVNLFDNATPEEVDHYQEQLTLIHEQFKMAITKYRPPLLSGLNFKSLS